MDKLTIKYRNWYQGTPPRVTKLEIPGWAGQPNQHKTGDEPQPWHCVPFVEGATYGLELCYSFDTECHVKLVDGKIVFEGDFSVEQERCKIGLPPFMSFSPHHFGMTSAVDIKVPEDYVLRLETHPKFYTDITNTVPCALTGHIQTEWWPKIFFVVFKNPQPGQSIIFRKGEPYAQILVLPKKVEYQVSEMTVEEKVERCNLDNKIERYAKHYVKNNWLDHRGNNFNDKYKILNTIFAKEGMDGLKKFFKQLEIDVNEAEIKAQKENKKISPRLIKKRKNESV